MTEPIAEDRPQEEPFRRRTWEEVRQGQIEWERALREHEQRWATQMAALRASVAQVKRQEELAARRRCWLF